MRNTAIALLWLSSFLLAKAAVYSNNQTYNGKWQLRLAGTTGVSAMQVAVVDDDNVLIFDKYEDNPLMVNGHPAWGAVYKISTSTVRPLTLRTNSFCAGGSWLGNGTMVNIGGDARSTNFTSDGRNAIRLFNPCGDADNCDIYEDPNIKLVTKRWYPTTIRLSDGSIFIMGGSTDGVFLNNAQLNNPTIEYYPPKNIAGYQGTSIPSQFLQDTLTANLFPIVILLPDDTLFVAADHQAMIYDWQTNTERRLPNIPNGVRITYPLTSGAVLLPLTPENGYTPEILICGGTTTMDQNLSVKTLSIKAPASTQCVRMVLNEQGIAGGWIVEQMPETRIMPDLVLLPGGDVLIVNGAKTGTAGFANVPNRIGQSNADNPNYRATLYRPNAPAGQRFFTAGIPASNIARMYHSTATLLPTGEILISGSNPNYDRTPRRYSTEYRAERLSPPYMNQPRPVLGSLPNSISYGGLLNIPVTLPPGTQVSNLSVALHDLGFATHSVHMNARMVGLQVISLSSDGTQLLVRGPPTPQVYPPGPAWLYVVANGIPSAGKKILVVQSQAPPPSTTSTTSFSSTPSPQTTGTGVWQSTASFTTIFVTTASVSGRCGAAFGTRTVCQTPLATCLTKTRAGYSVCSTAASTAAPSFSTSSTLATITSTSVTTSTSSSFSTSSSLSIPTTTSITTPTPTTTGTGVWQSTASFTTIQITTATVNGRCGAAFGTRTVCQTPIASCMKKAGAGISTCSPAPTQSMAAIRMTAP